MPTRDETAVPAGEPVAGRRRTIAFVANMVTNYRMSQYLLAGIAEQARREGLNLYCLPGNAAHIVVGFRQHLDTITHLISPATIDGLLVWGSGILGSTSVDNLALLFDRFKGFPIVNLGLAWEGLPSVAADNHRGMFDSVAHLIERHRCRRIAFIRGPARHPEADLRFQAYADALQEHGLPLETGLVVTGEFRQADGAAAVVELLDRRGVAFDALVASSDWMAFGAVQELAARGLAVPDAVKLAGFDDLEDCRYLKIPLTTVKQPFFELGRTGVKHLLALLEGRPVPAITTLPTALMIRESCGCENVLLREAAPDPPASGAASGAPDPAGVRERAAADVFREPDRWSLDRETAAGILDSLANALFTELDRGRPAFLSALGRELERVGSRDKLPFFHTVLSALRRQFLPLCDADPARRTEAENLWHKSRVLVSEAAFRASFTERTHQLVRNQMIQDINLLLLTMFNLSEFMNLFAQQLPRLGIRSCFLSLFDDPPAFSRSRLMLAYGDDARLDLAPGGVAFPTAALAPDGFLPRHRLSTFSIQPLYSGNEQLGFFLFEDRSQDLMMNELLRAQLSMAIRGALLFQEKEKLLADLEQRARDLQRTSEGLARSNAELEQFAFIASHDLQEPLRKMSVFAGRLESDFEGLSVERRRDLIRRIQNSCRHMKHLIDGLLSYSRLARQSPRFRRVDLAATIADVLSDMEPRVAQERAEIRIGPLPVIEAEPVGLRQLFQNILGNAVKFHRPGTPAVVSLTHRPVSVDGRDCAEFTVQDNGIGIEPRHFDRIFTLFQRLHGTDEFEGTGIGLAVCKIIAEQHGGTIRVESAPNAGASFIVTLPLTH